MTDPFDDFCLLLIRVIRHCHHTIPQHSAPPCSDKLPISNEVSDGGAHCYSVLPLPTVVVVVVRIVRLVLRTY